MKIIKSNSYNVINSEPFDIQLPCEFELWWGNTLLSQYRISEDGVVDYSFNPETDIKILTSTKRALSLNDIYYLISSRVFPDKTPFTALEMARFGITEYNPFIIATVTHGMFLVDKYWFRFSDQELSYKSALEDYQRYFDSSRFNVPDSAANEEQSEEESENYYDNVGKTTRDALAPDKIEHLDSIINQRNFDFEQVAENVSGEPMSSEEFRANVIGEDTSEPEEKSATDISPIESSDKMSEDAIAAMLAAAQTPEPVAPAATDSSSDKMSEDAIAAMLAAAQTPEPVAPPAPSSDKMSEDAIAAMLAAAQTPEPEETISEVPPITQHAAIPPVYAGVAAHPADEMIDEIFAKSANKETPADSSAKMSDDDIAAMIAAAQTTEPVAPPAPPAPSSDKMSDDAIAAMIAAAQTAEPVAPPEPPAPPAATGSSDKMSDDAIAEMLKRMGNT
ncbi:MAG: hypothetical protein FWH05_00055 [Oscillospiraceae bacterium]|nr:hypothetical protein [Oscillospiraceae bacterium]